ncbi:MAG: diaminopimelate epimerase [Gammaproteobacteria bacterium]|nr:diaminopimelate epimerase [Gammaproteobacteria bacterium]MDH5304707.1 diaminopimelate epimerase [Gammaproteobacteria bacterium]MDH5322869.1 diaminopimelate epimerase [Gammaproteobacteria bacterium]
MQLAFQKMQGAGNQILVVDQRNAVGVAPSLQLVRQIHGRDGCAGFDQLMWLGPPRTAGAAASYRVFNNDGSEVEQCGNGVRCVAVWLARQNDAPARFLFDSPAGRIEARIIGANRAAVNMGAPVFDDSIGTLEVAGQQIDVSVLSMGNPHCVLDVADVRSADVAGLGPVIERHALFPDRCNVGFMQIVDRSNIMLRVFERGAGETLACGTGACAAVAAGRRRGLLDDEVTVQLPGGQLVVSWRGGNEAIWLTGDAELISEGTIDL